MQVSVRMPGVNRYNRGIVTPVIERVNPAGKLDDLSLPSDRNLKNRTSGITVVCHVQILPGSRQHLGGIKNLDQSAGHQ